MPLLLTWINEYNATINNNNHFTAVVQERTTNRLYINLCPNKLIFEMITTLSDSFFPVYSYHTAYDTKGLKELLTIYSHLNFLYCTTQFRFCWGNETLFKSRSISSSSSILKKFITLYCHYSYFYMHEWKSENNLKSRTVSFILWSSGSQQCAAW